MPLYSDEAIVLRAHEFGEADRIISFFTRKHGKIRAMVKGAKKLKSRFSGRLEPFHRVDIVWFGKETTTLYKLSSAEIGQARTGIANDLDRFHRACYVTELVELATREGDPNPRAFLAADAALDLIASDVNVQSLEWITRFFDVKLLNHLGYGPTLDRCVKCRKSLPEKGKVSFDVAAGGAVCPTCGRGKTNSVSASQGAVKFLSRIIFTEFAKAPRLKPSPELMGEIDAVVRAFRDSRIQSKINSERFLFAGPKMTANRRAASGG